VTTTTTLTPRTTRHTLTVPEVAAAAGVSAWAIYSGLRHGNRPLGLEPLYCGRKILYATASVEVALALPPGTLSGGAEGVNRATAEVAR
jgi:hypothetical protein